MVLEPTGLVEVRKDNAGKLKEVPKTSCPTSDTYDKLRTAAKRRLRGFTVRSRNEVTT